MKITRSLFSSLILSLMFLGLLVLGVPLSGFATEPHICFPDNNGTISSNTPSSQSLGSTAQSTFTFYYQANNCGGHNSNTLLMGVRVYNNSIFPPTQITCSGNNGEPYQTNANPVPPDYYTVTCPSSGSLPAKIKTVIDYTVNGSTWTTHTDLFTNP
jgi:hypothetical protein